MSKILIYSTKNSNRLQYILKIIFKDAFGLEVVQTQNFDDFLNSELPKINYTTQEIDSALSIHPHTILFDVGIKDYPIEVIKHETFLFIFFKTNNLNMPFDLLGASFWLLSRYEEYLPHKSDIHNRFNYKSSLAYQYNFIEQPLINSWLKLLQHELIKKFPLLKFKTHVYNFISTVDIDNVFKYKHKGFVRSIAGYLNDILEQKYNAVISRYGVMFNSKKDPFDCYDFLIETHKQHNTKAIFFFLLGDYGPNDKNHSATNIEFQSLIKKIADYALVGIHPSYGSNNKIKQLKIEINRLTNIIHSTITNSRQHYSILKFPQTYQALIQSGIEEDFSMGYTNYNGFRASYCYPFKWYDLKNEMLTPLTLHPFCITENTIIYHAFKRKVSFIELAAPIINGIKQHNGQLISIFHNDTFSDEIKEFYTDFLKLANTKVSND